MKTHFYSLAAKFVSVRAKYFSDRNFLIICAILVGLVSGLASVLLKLTVHYIQKQLRIVLQDNSYAFLFYLFPLIGILLTVLFVQKIRKENSEEELVISCIPFPDVREIFRPIILIRIL